MACANVITNHVSMYLGPKSTLGGVPLGVDTTMTYDAVFDTSVPIYSTGYVGEPAFIYPLTSLTITLGGHGTFSALTGSLDFLSFPPESLKHQSPNTSAIYSSGLVDSVTPTHFGPYFLNRFASVNSSENYQALWNCHVKDITLGMTFSLNGGAGDLVMNDAGDSYDLTSELIGGQIFALDAVPEPRGWCAFAALGLAAFASIRQRR